jgi:hypothetical protein
MFATPPRGDVTAAILPIDDLRAGEQSYDR